MLLQKLWRRSGERTGICFLFHQPFPFSFSDGHVTNVPPFPFSPTSFFISKTPPTLSSPSPPKEPICLVSPTKSPHSAGNWENVFRPDLAFPHSFRRRIHLRQKLDLTPSSSSSSLPPPFDRRVPAECLWAHNAWNNGCISKINPQDITVCMYFQ